jgi:hypothetical protein
MNLILIIPIKQVLDNGYLRRAIKYINLLHYITLPKQYINSLEQTVHEKHCKSLFKELLNEAFSQDRNALKTYYL